MKRVRKCRPAVCAVKVKPSQPRPPGRGRWRRTSQLVLAAALLAGTLLPAPAGAQPPLWWPHHKTDDSENYYFVASAEACPTEQAARDQAFFNAERHISLFISGGFSDPDIAVRLSNRPFVGVDEVDSETVQYPQGWTCWVMVSYPKASHQKLVEQLARGVPAGPRHQVLVAPFAFDDLAVKGYEEVVAKYRQKGYGLDLWQTIEDVLEDSADFDPVTRPSKVIGKITDAVHSGAAVPDDLPEYLMVPNANFFDYREEELHWSHVLANQHHHVDVHLELYRREAGSWDRVATAEAGEVDLDELAASNTSARHAVEKLIERWRRQQPAQMTVSK